MSGRHGCRLSLLWQAGPLSLAVLRLLLSLAVLRLLVAVAPLEEHSSGLVDSAVAAQGRYSSGSVAGHEGLGAPRRVGSSWARDGACVLCIGRQTLPWDQGSLSLIYFLTALKYIFSDAHV